MSELLFKLEKNLLTKQNQEITASGAVNTNQCKFEFSAEWADFVKTAVFYQDKKNVSYAVLGTTHTCLIPAAAMARKGPMFIGVFGIRGSDILTSTVETVEILEGAITGIELNIEPSEDIFLAIIAQYQAISEKMELHNQKAAEIKTAQEQLNTKVDLELERQNEVLESLKAFDVIIMQQTVNEIQATHEDFTSRMATIERNTFTLPNQTIEFTNKVYRLEDARITSDSLVDVYFSSDVFDEAIKAKLVIESCNGYIQMGCEQTPQYPLYASMLVRRV